MSVDLNKEKPSYARRTASGGCHLQLCGLVCVDKCTVEMKGAAHLADLTFSYDALFATVAGDSCPNVKYPFYCFLQLHCSDPGDPEFQPE